MDNNEKGFERPKSAFRLWIENYWYHHKLVTLFALFFIFAAIICIVQVAENNSYDSYIMYAGPCQMSRKQLLDLEVDFYNVVEDEDGDGKTNVAIRELFIMSPEEIRELNELDNGYEANTTLIANNIEVFDQEILAGEATICLLSPFLFERVCEADGFLPIAEFVGDADVEFVGEYGVKLNSTKFGNLLGLSVLPDDTIICVRRVSTIASLFERKTAERNHARNLETVRRIFEYN